MLRPNFSMLRNMVHLPLCQEKKVNELSEKQVFTSSYIRMNCLAPCTYCSCVLSKQTVNMTLRSSQQCCKRYNCLGRDNFRKVSGRNAVLSSSGSSNQRSCSAWNACPYLARHYDPSKYQSYLSSSTASHLRRLVSTGCLVSSLHDRIWQSHLTWTLSSNCCG